MNTPVQDGRKRVVIEGVKPQVDGGRFPAKRTVGDRVRVEADIFTDGHDSISALLLYKEHGATIWNEQPMQAGANDRWFAEMPVTRLGRHYYTIQAWIDHFETWRRDLKKRIMAETDTAIDYRIGADFVEECALRASRQDGTWLRGRADLLRTAEDVPARRAAALDEALNSMMRRYPDRHLATDLGRELEVVVDPVLARFSSWYEFFPRSMGSSEAVHGTFADCEARLPYVAGMGFDVLYLPPIHPIGTQFRKGKNNSTTTEPGDVGSPWAIGAAEGGHKSIHPQLGTIDDFRRLVKTASGLGIQIALDIAFQVSPDHPYVREHEEWFRKRPDGTIQYAENPPKKYQDIYPFEFETAQWFELWQELKSIFFYWIEQGVRIFRVDNPHTKPFPFWEWVIHEIKKDYPEVLFLSEAFTRPKIMYRLAKVGFSQSYTYFPWRNVKHELELYMTELAKTDVRDFFRPNHWPNTPDILTEFLQTSGRAGFAMRLILAATLGANYGIYGPAFELQDARPRQEGSEEYLNSEKYQIRHWDLDHPDSLRDLIALVNRIRRENTALQNDWTLQFHKVNNDQLICYSKQSEDGSDLIVVVVNLDPNHKHAGHIELPLADLKLESNRPYQAHELLTGARYIWHGSMNYVELDPASVPAHIFRIRRQLRSERDFEYFL